MFKISIIIATYNAGKTIKQSLNSIREQSYNYIEVLGIDGGSTDNTLYVVDEFSDIVQKVISEKDNGIYDAFNKGIDYASGDFVYFLGADDSLVDNTIIEKVERVLSFESCVTSFPVIAVDEETKTEFIVNNRRTKEQIFSGNMLPHQGLFVRTDVMKKYKFNLDYSITSDYDFIVRYVLDGGRIDFFDFPVAYYSMGGTSSNVYGSDNWKKMLYEHTIIMKKHDLSRDFLKSTYEYILFEDISPRSTFFIKQLTKQFFNWIHLSSIVKRIKNKKHKCKLHLCRWCNRYEGL